MCQIMEAIVSHTGLTSRKAIAGEFWSVLGSVLENEHGPLKGSPEDSNKNDLSSTKHKTFGVFKYITRRKGLHWSS